MSCSLYRHFANDGALLYVGISLSWPARTKAHAGGSRWFDLVAKVEIERFETRDAALDAERNAIKAEKPQFNIIHNRVDATTAKPKTWRDNPKLFDDPLLNAIKGPDAIVGPALIYTEDYFSVMIAHGEAGTAGNLTEALLGQIAPELPDYAHMIDTIISIRRANDITREEAGDVRRDIIKKLKKQLRSVEAFETDLSFAVAYAARFPSKKSRKVLDDIAVERNTTTQEIG